MSIKVQIAIFAQSRNLSEEILKKIIKLRKKLNIFLVVSDNEFRKKLIQNKFRNFVWLKNNKNNSSKIINILEKYDSKILYAFSLQHRWIVSQKVIEKFKLFINFHYGDLPLYRGHNPVIHSILNNEKYILGTVHSIDEKLDNGLIIGKVKVKNYKITSKDAERKLTIKFAEYFKNLIIRLTKKHKLILKKINKTGSKFYSIDEIKKLKEVKNFNEIIKKTYAFDYPPHEPAFIKIKGIKVYLKIKLNSK
jgi:methionyl-tRNA formyltransferase